MAGYENEYSDYNSVVLQWGSLPGTYRVILGHYFTSPYPCGVAGLVKMRGILAAPEHPFSLLLTANSLTTLRVTLAELRLGRDIDIDILGFI